MTTTETTRRRFRLDSATAEEVQDLSERLVLRIDGVAGYFRAERLLLHWWALGHDPARSLRCPRCVGGGKVSDNPYRVTVRCPTCNGRGTR